MGAPWWGVGLSVENRRRIDNTKKWQGSDTPIFQNMTLIQYKTVQWCSVGSTSLCGHNCHNIKSTYLKNAFTTFFLFFSFFFSIYGHRGVILEHFRQLNFSNAGGNF